MSYLPFVVSGLVTGSVYGLAGTGLVLTYKTSAVFNFAHGAIATVAAYLFWDLTVQHGAPWGLAAAICVAVGGPVMGLVLELLARQLAAASLSTKVAATVGVLLVVQAGTDLVFDPGVTRNVAQYLPDASFHVGSTVIRASQLIVIGVAVVASAALWVFFRTARLGVAMRAVVDSPVLLDVAGTSPTRVRRWSWIIGASFASASGVLLAPLLSELNSINLTFLVVTAFGAAAIGAFTNLPATFLGGLLIGVVQQLCTKWFTGGFWTGLSPALPFLVLFVVLLVSPRRRLVEQAPVVQRARSTWRMPLALQGLSGLGALVFLLFVPSIVGFHLADYTTALTYVLLFLALGLLVRTSGQVSLAHVSFMAIGVCAMSHLTVDHHVPWALALVLSGLIAVPIGAVLSIPAIRLSGLYLALATFGFGLLLQYMFYSESYMFTSNASGLTVPRPAWFNDVTHGDRRYYYLVLGLVVVATVAIITVNRSRLGRLLRALADSPTGLATSGTSINVTRVLVFCGSAFLAAVAGALQGANVTSVSGSSYQPLQSLVFFALITISVGSEPWYAILAAFGLQLSGVLYPISSLQSPKTQGYLTLAFGIAAVLYAVTPEDRRQVPMALQRSLDRLGFRRPAPPRTIEPVPMAPVRSAGSLKVEGLKVAFGGLVAVDGVTLEAPTGRITGLIGPNGAGKTTTFNSCSGLNRPSAGTVQLDGRSVALAGPSARARRGLGRTFQQMELFDTLTVRQNVALGAEASNAGPNALRHLISSPAERRRVAAAADQAMLLCGIVDIEDRVVGALSTGERRLVELARCLAGPFHLLLLDEPSSGLDPSETQRFGEILRRVVAERGLGILLVEHDMTLVTAICDYLYVLDFGKPIFEGTVVAALQSPIVKAAYLGGDEVEDAVGAAEPPDAPADTRSRGRHAKAGV
ncbi:MAG TPA: ATP-binding cassette domain-containing protein [Mycobacteriales bacterium]|nr:ATP-binding cassette domain-containing protein [Mycobacteriales bacterium]